MGDFPQIQTRVDIKKLHAQTSSTAFRRHSFSDYMLRSRNMDTEQGTRNNDSIDATQDATIHYPDKKEVQERLRKQDIEPKEENGKVDITEIGSSDDESDDDQSTKSKDDVDSEVTFEADPDEEMVTIEIEEEEDWIEYINEKHCRRIGQNGTRKDSMLEQDSQKMKWKLALRIATSPCERWLKKAAEWNPDLSSRF